MTDPSLPDLINEVADLFERRGWRDPGGQALHVADALRRGQSPRAAANAVSSQFLAANAATREQLAEALQAVNAAATRPSVGATTSREAELRTSQHDRIETSATWITGAPVITTLRILAAGAVAILGTQAAVVGPDAIRWDWLLNHANRYAIQGLGVLTVLLVSAGLLLARWPAIALAGAAFIALLAVLGGVMSASPAQLLPSPSP